MTAISVLMAARWHSEPWGRPEGLGTRAVLGTIPLVAEDDNRVRNATLVFNADGERVARYDKLHLFGFTRGDEQYNESRTIEAGDDVVSFDAPWGRTGLVIC